MTEGGPRPVLVVIDDNAVDREAVRRLVGREFDLVEAETAREGLDRIGERAPDCVLVDYRLPDASGVELVEGLRSRGLPVVMLSGAGSEAVAVAALKRGAHDYLVKDRLSAEALRVAVRGAIQQVALEGRIQEQQQALERFATALARQTEQLRVLLDQLPALVWTTDTELRVTSLSGRHPGGVELAPGEPIPHFAPGFREAHEEALRGVAGRPELRLGQLVYELRIQPLRDVAEAPIGTIGLLVDVTEHRRLQDQLLHAQRMEAMGRLAGGVAHDFNNLLTIVLNCTELARETLEEGHPAREDLDEVLGASVRASGLTRQLLAFARRRPSNPEAVAVSRHLGDITRMLARLLGEDIELRETLRGEGVVNVDPGSLEQVVVNLAINARDAMPSGGVLVVDVDDVELGDGWTDAHGQPLAPGAYVRVIVDDTGTGIPPEVLPHIFEPFFTTKATGSGTGLGLATVFGIVSQAGGAIRVTSEPGHGTALQVYLPRIGAGPIHQPAPEPFLGGGADEVVVVVDDDPTIRDLAARVLAGRGYRPRVARSAEHALAMLADADERVDLVLTDVVMPGLSGVDLARRARELRPGLPVLLMSGYSPQALRHGTDGVHVVQKPFTPTGLAEAVHRVLVTAAARPA